MEKKAALDFLNRIAEGIAKTFGNTCETVIHDLYNEKNSIIAIYNGHVSKRKVGDKFNILGANRDVNVFLVENTDFINCQGKTSDGKIIKSSTFHLVGDGYHYALGINFDYTVLSLAESVIKELTKVGENIDEAINESGEDRLKSIFEDCLKTIGKPLSMLNKDDRMRIVCLLQEKNAFSFQKSIPFISEKLNVSRYTIYNYLKAIQK